MSRTASVAQPANGMASSRNLNDHMSDEVGTSPKVPQASPPKESFSEWSHQAANSLEATNVLSEGQSTKADDDFGDWQEMPAYAAHDIYDDESGKIVAHADMLTAENLAGRAKGYSRVQGDDDARSVDSVDEQTNHLFNAGGDNSGLDDEATVTSQLSHTKTLLTEGQRIAYIGLCKLVLVSMLKDATTFNSAKESKGEGRFALESMILWSQKITLHLYQHIEITPEEQLMMEQLSEHKIRAEDLAPALTTALRVSNPLNDRLHTNRSTPLASSNKKSSNIVKEAMADAQTSAAAPMATTDVSSLENTEKLDLDIRWTVLFDLFLLLIADAQYDSRSRVFFIQVAEVLGVTYLELAKFEKKVTDALEVQDQQDAQVSQAEEISLTTTRDKSSRNRRYVMMGLATLGGGLVIGLSAGFLAPVIGAGLGAGFASVGISGASSFLAGTTGAALITTSGVLTGSTIATRSAAKRVSSVKTFEFKPLYDNRRVNLLVTIPGWLAGKEDDVRLPFSTIDPVMGDICSVLWEPELLRTFQATGNILATEVLTQSLQQVLGQTVLTALMSALQWPLVLTKLSYLIDNPWSNSLDRAKAAGLILADALVSRSLGVRPISLVGYSLGARVIYFALLELARVKAFGIVENVYLFGAPIVVTQRDWRRAKSVVSGRFVNGFVRNDWILGYLFRATSGGIGRVAGLRPVDGIESVENLDCTGLVAGHMGYRQAIPILMKKIGYEITSEEFQEIEDPDPDKTRERAQELLDDIQAARQNESLQKKKRSFFTFGRSKNLVSPEALPVPSASSPVYDGPIEPSSAGDSKFPETVSAAEVPQDKFDITQIRNEAKRPMPFSRGHVDPTRDDARLRSHSVENISMTFDTFIVDDQLPTSHGSKPDDTPGSQPSGYVPRPSLQHAKTASGLLPSDHSPTSPTYAQQHIHGSSGAVLDKDASRQSFRQEPLDEDFKEEGEEITMSFG